MIVAEVSLGAPHWLPWAALLSVLALAGLAWSYWRSHSSGWVRGAAALLKTAGIVALAVCLVEPLFTGTRPRPGSNLFLVVADNSRSLQLADGGSRETRGGAMQRRLKEEAAWLARLGQDYDVRRYTFDTQLRPVSSFAELSLEGDASALRTALAALSDRFRSQPVAGILLLTDGNATDLAAAAGSWKDLPPIYPVALGAERGPPDLSVARVSVSQTNFEAAPVTITAEINGQGVAGKKIVVRVLSEEGKEVERRTIDKLPAGEPLVERFLLRPENPGISFFTVQTSLAGEENAAADSRRTAEATLANNRRLATVDRGGGPYRVLYVSGRPNWEYKFLRRAIDEDDEVELVGLIRIAKKEPKFTFLGRPGERTNPLFRGFGNQGDEQAEEYDQPVLVRLGTESDAELRDGFPKDADDLYRYHAVILDDIEAAFFTQDQLSLLQQFVSQRGGGFLMLAGKDSLADGRYARSPVGEMLPVYLDRASPPTAGSFKLTLTREGWLQPWVRVRKSEADEEQRLAAMPAFKTIDAADSIKPGAAVLAQVTATDGSALPALVVQPFGRGRTAALLVGDLWRWNLRRTDPADSDLEKSWRQTVRWLVAEVPQRVEVETRSDTSVSGGLRLVVTARDERFAPLDNAAVSLQVETPGKRRVELTAESSAEAPGRYETTFVSRESGAYRAKVTVTAADGSQVGQRDTGWTVEPQSDEFRTLGANRKLLAELAQQTGGEVLKLDGLERFVTSLPSRKIPIVETWTYPLWHQWPVFLLALTCLAAEWGLRRWKGLP
ncbi:MAG TPA: hypothetical protein VMP01_06420 [Pirellulaceae bacterium]|nr:hypothetical protein [Pirellulaceae bacterium]